MGIEVTAAIFTIVMRIFLELAVGSRAYGYGLGMRPKLTLLIPLTTATPQPNCDSSTKTSRNAHHSFLLV